MELKIIILLLSIVLFSCSTIKINENGDHEVEIENILFYKYYDENGILRCQKHKHVFSRKQTIKLYYSNGILQSKGKTRLMKSGFDCVQIRQVPYGKWKYWNKKSELVLIVKRPVDTLFISKDIDLNELEDNLNE